MERVIRDRSGHLQSIDILRESVKLLTEGIADYLLGEKAKNLKQSLLATASKHPLQNHLDANRMEEVAEKLFELYYECRILLRKNRAQKDDMDQIKLVVRAGQLLHYIMEIFEFEAEAIFNSLSSFPASDEEFPINDVDRNVYGILKALEQYARNRDQPKTQLRLWITISGGKLEVSKYDGTATSYIREKSSLPFTPNELNAVLKAISGKVFDPKQLTREEIDYLIARQIVHKRQKGNWLNQVFSRHPKVALLPGFHKRLGSSIFTSLFSGDIAVIYRRQRSRSKPLTLRLYLDPEFPILAQIPWELIYDDRINGGFPITCARNGIEVSRCFGTGMEVKQRLEIVLPLKVLFIDADPKPNNDEQDLHYILKPFDEEGQLTWRSIKDPTWERIKEELSQNTYQIVHYHGRGAFGRLCDRCEYVNASAVGYKCHNCGNDISAIEPQGYLFPGLDSIVRPVSAEEFGAVLNGNGAEIVVLDANSSATVANSSIYSGLAPCLMMANLPAVIALQNAMKRGARAKVIRRFYSGLVSEEAVPEAINNGRREIFANASMDWFKPVIYMNTNSRYGDLHYASILRGSIAESSNGRENPLPQAVDESTKQAGLSKKKKGIVLNLIEIFRVHFSIEELKDYCVQLDIDFQNLSPSGKASVTRDLVQYLDRHNRIEEAISVGKELRPDIEWDKLMGR